MPQAGQGNVVEPFSTSGTPDAVHVVALSDRFNHLGFNSAKAFPSLCLLDK